MSSHVHDVEAYAHPLEADYDIGPVQEPTGHNDVSTTMIYIHVPNKPEIAVKSPLDV